MGSELLEPFVISPEDHELLDDDVIVFFPDFIDGDIGVYHPSVLAVTKRLLADGENVRYAYPPERRTWLREYSAGERAIDFAIGVASGIPLLLIQYLLSIGKDRVVRVKVTTARKIRGRRMWDAQIVEIHGSGVEVAKALRSLEVSTDGE